jgi:hydroxyethylthiazole kinase-like sugar kinase family protein
MSPAQVQAWDKLLSAEYTALYWRYRAAKLWKVILAVNVVAGLAGTSALILLIADDPLATKVVALAAAVVALWSSYSSVGSDYAKATASAAFYSKLAQRSEKVWNHAQQIGTFEDEIVAELNALDEQEALAPESPGAEYDERLRDRVYRIVTQSKGIEA